MQETDKLQELSPFFMPRGVALIGASEKPGKVGRLFMDRYIEAGFENLYPINLKENEILGFKAYPNVKEVADPVDLAIILLPPFAVKDAVQDCVDKGEKAIIINSAGFAEESAEGKAKQDELVAIARSGGARIIGPNCIGVYSPMGKIPFPMAPPMITGKVGIVSQSGSLADHLALIATKMGIHFSKAISVGNESDLKVTDFMEYLGQDPETDIILSYLEGVNDGQRYHQLTREISKTKPIIVWKCGVSEQGAKAAASHTGSMAGSHQIWDGVFENNGIVSVKSFEELIDCTYAFHNVPLPKGNRIAIITGPGGPAVGTTDACIRMGLEVPTISEETQEKLAQALPPVGTSLANPIDLSMVAAIAPQLYGEVVKILGEDDSIDMMLAIGNGGDVFYDGIINATANLDKPVALSVLMPLDVVTDGHTKLAGSKAVVYPDPIRAANALSKLARYGRFQQL
mgnify:FL=1